METRYIIGLIVCIIVSIVLGYLIGKNSKKPLGDIVFETYMDDETDQPSVRCTFKLDLDIDEIVKKDYILFGVKKNRDVIEYYSQNKQSL